MLPTDAPHEGTATATVSAGGGGSLTGLAYTWEHPTDGPQEGLLVLGLAEDPDRVVALWSDSWHQTTAQVLTGALDGKVVTVSFTYGGDWEWVIAVDGTEADTLRIQMDNVVPASMAAEGHSPGAYWAMDTELRRSR
jgi:hypothetical protein